MKKALKMFSLTLIAFIALGVTNVKADGTLNYILPDGTTKSIVIKDDDTRTILDLKKEISKVVNIDTDHLLLKNENNTYENDEAQIGEYLYFSETGILTYTVVERKEIEENEITLKAVKPTNEDEKFVLLESFFPQEFPGYTMGNCNESYDECELRLYSNGKFYKNVKVNFAYDENDKKLVDSIIKKLNGKTIFDLKDLEFINYWVYGGSPINYSNEFKSAIDYKNFYLDVRAGTDDILTTAAIGMAAFTYNDTLYASFGFFGFETKNILYVSDNTKDENIMKTIQERIDNYIGKGIVEISKYDTTLQKYIDDTINYYLQFVNPNGSEEEKQAYKDEINKLKELSSDGILYIAKIGKTEKLFLVKKDSNKMYTPSYKTSDIKTNITITSTDNTLPLDTLIQVKELTSGEEYDKIIKILNTTNNDMFDLKLFSNSTNKYITKLNDGSFEVRIPIKDELKDKDLVVYYVNNNSEKEEYEVKVENGEAVFNTNHFSIYTLAERTSTIQKIENPQTGDNIITYILIGSISMIALIGCTLYLKKNHK